MAPCWSYEFVSAARRPDSSAEAVVGSRRARVGPKRSRRPPGMSDGWQASDSAGQIAAGQSAEL